MAVGEDAYCTLVMTDSYLPGAAVLAHSLRDCDTTKKLAVLVCYDTLRQSTIDELRNLYDYVIPVDRIGNPNPKNLYLMDRADLLFTFTKINLWRQTQFRKIVYIDADIVALRAPDELFDITEDFAAAPDVGWPDAFNTGVMVLAPHMGDYWSLRTLASAGDSFDGADQGLLNQYYEHKPWKRISFKYNCTPSANYQYEPAYRFYKHDTSMVHFIGADKPWKHGRKLSTPPSGYQELLSRWWAVYDRHFTVSTEEYAATAQGTRTRDQYYATGYPASDAIQSHPQPPPEADVTSTEAPFTEPGEVAENIDQGLMEPTPTLEARRFSAPQIEWDATRAPPPAASKPEASNFPSQIYEFNTDPRPFQAPASYPEPPKNMWFEVPKEAPRREEKPPPIFPWEERPAQKPSRFFAEDTQHSPPEPAEPAEPDSPPFAGADEFEVSADDKPPTPVIKISQDPWEAFGSVNKNAWDDIAGIDTYVRALSEFQKNKGASKKQGYQRQAQSIMSPTQESEPAELVEQVRQRRESLLLTDFPTAIERPSLPVTPAPRRRTTFWGDERDDQGNLPAAEGVPDQADWNPAEQLESLRRNSVLGPSDLKLPNRKLSQRDPIPSGVPIIHEEATSPPKQMKKPTFVEPDFSAAATKIAEPVPQQQSRKPTFVEPAFALDGADDEDDGDEDEERGVEGKKRVRTFAEPGFPDAGKEEVLSPTESRSSNQ